MNVLYIFFSKKGIITQIFYRACVLANHHMLAINKIFALIKGTEIKRVLYLGSNYYRTYLTMNTMILNSDRLRKKSYINQFLTETRMK